MVKKLVYVTNGFHIGKPANVLILLVSPVDFFP